MEQELAEQYAATVAIREEILRQIRKEEGLNHAGPGSEVPSH